MALITEKVKMREEFESWFKANTNNNGGVAFYVGINGKYCFTDIEMAWQSWQASRAALVLELPFEFASGMIRLSTPSKPQE